MQLQSLDNQLMLIVGFSQINQHIVSEPRIAIVIPARMASQRLPGKALLDILGLPMVEHVRRRALMNKYDIPVFVTSGDKSIIDAITNFQGNCLESKEEHTNGLSRTYEVSKNLDFTHYIILQGDEVLVTPGQIEILIESIQSKPTGDFWNLTTALVKVSEIEEPSIVKCMLDLNGFIMSIFRKSPLTSNYEQQMKIIKKICGLFAVSSLAMKVICESASTPIEICESIEQMKYLELGGDIQSIDTASNFTSINLPSDVEEVLKVIESSDEQKKLVTRVLSYAH
jgi:3-deoxy-manno-octulosonate cytidylyltransferase (CMP-KDO synthetase)